MLRRLAVVAGLCLLPVGNAVFALGLGDIKVTSGLNQRFEATIPFTSLTSDEADSLKVSLADNDAFARAGLDRAQYLSSLTLEAVTDEGKPFVRISSTQIVREPLLTILIEVKAGGPRVLREYTVLLDPPGPESNVSRPFAREEATPKKQRDVPAPSEFYKAAKAKEAAEAPPQFIPGASKYGPLRVGDTLWSVAQKVKPTGVPLAVEQVMLPLFQNNPDGFVDNNPNTLRKGAMLTVPTLDEMRKVDAVTAKEQVRALMAGEPLPGTAAATPPAETAPATTTTPAATSGTGTAPIAGQPGVDPAGTAATGTTPAPGTPSVGTAPATGTPGVDAEAPAKPAEAAPAATVTQPADAPVKRPPEPSLLSRLLPVFIALIVIAIGLVIWRTWRERRATREYEQAARAAAAPPLARSTVSAMPKPMSARDELEELNRRIDEDATRVDTAAGKSESDFETIAASTGKIPPYTGPVGGRAEPEVAEQFSNTTQIDLGANDPIAEADFHLAYGLYEEAALLLRQAADREPGRTDVRSKLAETYFAAGKPAEFQEVAQSLRGQLNPEEWGKLAIMGRQLAPDSPLFAGGGDVAVDLDFDEPADNETVAQPTKARVDDGLDFSLDELALPAKDAKPAFGARSGDQPPLEFDLGEFDLAGTTKTAKAPPKSGNAGELSLQDFDLANSKEGDKARGGLDIRLEDVHPDAGLEDSLEDDTISSGEDVATKLDLARAYVEMGDSAMARTLLDEVATQGSDEQKREASQLRERLLG